MEDDAQWTQPCLAERLRNMHEYRRFVQEQLDERGWTPGGFARKAGMHRQTITKIVNDDRDHIGQMPDESTLQGIADGFKIDVERVRQAAARSLAGYVEPETSYPPMRISLTEDSVWYRQILGSAQTLIEFAIDADAVDDQASGMDLGAADVERLRIEVERLLATVDRLTQRIHDEAMNGVGDLELLRAIKSDVLRRRRLERLGRADASDDLLSEFFRFLQSEDARGLEDDELPRRFLESRATSVDEPEADGLEIIKGVVDSVALEEPDEGNHEGA